MPRARSHMSAPSGVAQQSSTTVGVSALSMREVCALTGLCRSHVYSLIAKGMFPRPAKIGRRSIWSRAEVVAWLEARFAERFDPGITEDFCAAIVVGGAK